MENSQWWAGYTLNTTDKIKDQALAVGTSLAQKVELIALARDLELSQGKNINIYIDSKYDFMVVLANGAILKERGFLTLGSKYIKHRKEILQLLEAVNLLNKIAIMYCLQQQDN